MKYVLIGSGDLSKRSNFKNFAYDAKVIACDGGLGHCRDENVVPDVMVGDFDSVKSEDYVYFKDMGVKEHRYPSHKDMTDMEIGIDLAINMGADEIFIFGGLGSRMDHSIGNIQLLYKPLRAGIKAHILNSNNAITLANRDTEFYNLKKGQIVSLIPLTTEVKGVTTSGLEYSLEDATMTIGNTLGVSNIALGDSFSLKIKEGILIVFLSRD